MNAQQTTTKGTEFNNNLIDQPETKKVMRTRKEPRGGNMPKLKKFAAEGLTQRVVSALGVMVGTDSGKFYTASDVTDFMLKRNFPQTHITNDEFMFVSGRVNTALYQSYATHVNDVKRSPRKMSPLTEVTHEHPKLKSAYAYRVGHALTAPRNDADAIQATADAGNQLTSDRKNPLGQIAKLITHLSFNELVELQLDCVAHMQSKHEAANEINSQAKTIIGKLEGAFQEIQSIPH